MRITLQIDDDVHSFAKKLAAARGQTLGQVISDLARTTLTRPRGNTEPPLPAPSEDKPSRRRRPG